MVDAKEKAQGAGVGAKIEGTSAHFCGGENFNGNRAIGRAVD